MGIASRLHPRSSRATRLILAAGTWTTVGAALLGVGLGWVLPAPAWTAGIPLAVALGWAKGRFVLSPRARRNAERIVAAGEARCVGGMFSWSSWAIAAVMVAAGAFLRRSPIPRPWLGLVYVAVGTALLTASLDGWRSWRRYHLGAR